MSEEVILINLYYKTALTVALIQSLIKNSTQLHIILQIERKQFEKSLIKMGPSLVNRSLNL